MHVCVCVCEEEKELCMNLNPSAESERGGGVSGAGREKGVVKVRRVSRRAIDLSGGVVPFEMVTFISTPGHLTRLFHPLFVPVDVCLRGSSKGFNCMWVVF
ncbi:unnamed protein product [Boreogadus saida]